MTRFSGGKHRLAALCLFSAPALFGARLFGDIPGDGSIRCSVDAVITDTVACDTNHIGTSSAGTLQIGGSNLALNIAGSPAFITFDGGIGQGATVGPLGLNPEYNPDPAHTQSGNPQRDVTIPVTGQQITLTLTNTGAQPVTAVAFYLLLNPLDFEGSYTPRNDGLTFGAYCTGLVDANDPADACNVDQPQNYALLATPTGPGTLNSDDLNANTETFGDLLRFSGLNLAQGQSANFSFFITDYKPTRIYASGGGDPNAQFALAVVPSAIPEPGTVSLILCAALGAFVWRRRASNH